MARPWPGLSGNSAGSWRLQTVRCGGGGGWAWMELAGFHPIAAYYHARSRLEAIFCFRWLPEGRSRQRSRAPLPSAACQQRAHTSLESSSGLRPRVCQLFSLQLISVATITTPVACAPVLSAVQAALAPPPVPPAPSLLTTPSFALSSSS